MQILKKTKMKGLKKAIELGSLGVINLLLTKQLVGRGGAGFPTGKKWEFALSKDAEEKFVICNADEGEPGTFKDKFILNNNPETLIEGIIIAAHVIRAKQAFIYLRGEYEYLEENLKKVTSKVIKESGHDIKIDIVVGAGAYVCGDETAIIESISGKRGHPYYKPPFPPVEGLWGKPTIINNVETLTNVPQAILFDDWDSQIRLFSISGNVTKPGVYELPVGTKLSKLMDIAKPKNKPKAIFFGCFGGCMPYDPNTTLTRENILSKHCALGAYTIIVVDDNQSIVNVCKSIAFFYEHESCGKCTPCREGNKRILDLLNSIKKGEAKKEDLNTLWDLADQIHQTSLCGLGQTATSHVLTSLEHFRPEFEAMVK